MKVTICAGKYTEPIVKYLNEKTNISITAQGIPNAVELMRGLAASGMLVDKIIVFGAAMDGLDASQLNVLDMIFAKLGDIATHLDSHHEIVIVNKNDQSRDMSGLYYKHLHGLGRVRFVPIQQLVISQLESMIVGNKSFEEDEGFAQLQRTASMTVGTLHQSNIPTSTPVPPTHSVPRVTPEYQAPATMSEQIRPTQGQNMSVSQVSGFPVPTVQSQTPAAIGFTAESMEDVAEATDHISMGVPNLTETPVGYGSPQFGVATPTGFTLEGVAEERHVQSPMSVKQTAQAGQVSSPDIRMEPQVPNGPHVPPVEAPGLNQVSPMGVPGLNQTIPPQPSLDASAPALSDPQTESPQQVGGLLTPPPVKEEKSKKSGKLFGKTKKDKNSAVPPAPTPPAPAPQPQPQYAPPMQQQQYAQPMQQPMPPMQPPPPMQQPPPQYTQTQMSRPAGTFRFDAAKVEKMQKRQRVITFTGNERAGVSGMVANVATIAQVTGMRTIVLDLDFYGRGQTLYYPQDINPEENYFTNAIANAMRSPISYQNYVWQITDTLDILGLDLSVGDIKMLEDSLTGAKLSDLISNLRTQYDLVLVDLPFKYIRKFATLIGISDRIAFVTENDIPSLVNVANKIIPEQFETQVDYQTFRFRSGFILNKYNPASTLEDNLIEPANFTLFLDNLLGESEFSKWPIFGAVERVPNYVKQFDGGTLLCESSGFAQLFFDMLYALYIE